MIGFHLGDKTYNLIVGRDAMCSVGLGVVRHSVTNLYSQQH